ncbi:ribose-5-phosphate isomerase RpiA [Halosimplex litoreum]|uniref:Ribose-5-phosphate isomerase A n=1 Tax=Halosimplex litoreum TaxID=1198301 RepID=A0A7T3KUC5_9EURY|nr:ribose-5-phosphate isomerase RpiA [Halosimplex litoreum]QPV61828.1 ribose-5-phosphate isomerase RpiA [Halosimplex litoreum]
MNQSEREAAKRRAGERAVEAAEDGSVVGLGSGSTAAHAIRALGREVDAGLDVEGVPTSFQAREIAIDVGIPLTTLDEADVTLAIDGADQIAGRDLLKGGGGAHAREKIVDAAADRLLVVADPTKEVDVLDGPVPVEVLPDARTPVADAIRRLGGRPELRRADRKSGPVVSDNGNLILDCEFGAMPAPTGLAADLSALPGVVEHGLFVDFADEVCLGTETDVTVFEP